MKYLAARLQEKDTHAALLAAAYAVANALIPPQYALLLHAVAAVFGVGVVATPNYGPK